MPAYDSSQRPYWFNQQEESTTQLFTKQAREELLGIRPEDEQENSGDSGRIIAAYKRLKGENENNESIDLDSKFGSD